MYDPNHLDKYLTEIINKTSQQVIKYYKLRYEIYHRKNTDTHLIFSVKYNYRKPRNGNVDNIIKSKNQIFLQKSNWLIDDLNKLFDKLILKGINGLYEIILPLTNDIFFYYDKDINLSIKLPYKKVESLFDILPKELVLIIINKLDYRDINRFHNSKIIKYHLLDSDYIFSMSVENKTLFDDLIIISKNFSDFPFTWEDIYFYSKKFYTQFIYIPFDNTKDIKDNILIGITADMTPIYNNFFPSRPSQYGITPQHHKYYEMYYLFFEVRLMFLFPDFYNKLLQFHYNFKSDRKDWHKTIEVIYNIIQYESPTLIYNIINDYPNTTVRIFPRNIESIFVNIPTFHNTIGLLCDSPIFLWYYLNIPKVNFQENDGILPSEYYNILESLDEKIDIDLYIHKLSNSLVNWLINKIDTPNTYSYVISDYVKNKLYHRLLFERENR